MATGAEKLLVLGTGFDVKNMQKTWLGRDGHRHFLAPCPPPHSLPESLLGCALGEGTLFSFLNISFFI